MPSHILIPVPTSFDEEYNQRCWPQFARAIEACGAVAVRVPCTAIADIPAALLDSAAGLLLPGSGADVSPARYGHEVQPESAPPDPVREALDFHLLELAERRKLPTLAVCFGLQSLNVYRGGTLVQHLAGLPVNHSAGHAVATAHAVVVPQDAQLGRTLHGAADVQPDANTGFLRVLVNSSHHQAIGVPGDGLRVVARSTEDGVIEAIEDDSHPFLLGVQWHPERNVEQSPASRALMRAFVEAAVAHA